MQNRGLIKFFAIIFALVCVYQLSFTFVANSIVSDAKAFAKGDTAKELRYLDSIGKEEVYLGHTYKEVTNKWIHTRHKHMVRPNNKRQETNRQN